MLRVGPVLLALSAMLPYVMAAAVVRELNGAEALQIATQRQRRLVVLMYDGECAVVKAFQPWLFALAQMVPNLPITRVDVSRQSGMLKSVFQLAKTPQVKAIMRDNPKGEKVINYKGPMEFEALLEWLQAVYKEVPHKLSEFGVEPPEAPEGSGKRGRAGSSGDPMGHLPESVRGFATTMVRENRLQRKLAEQGGGRLDAYNAKVTRRYQEILRSEETTLDDKYAIQEANRRARDEVHEEILAQAPEHIRDEVMGDVRMGDIAESQKEKKR